MYENEYMYAVQRDDEYLAHYGIRGMKWGVRKARESGNAKKLGRQYAKAQKKLAKLEKRAVSGKKYAKRAAALGAGAAAAGGLAVAGTGGGGTGLAKMGNASRQVLRKTGNAVTRLSGGKYAHVGNVLKTAGNKSNAGLIGAGNAVKAWGQSNSIGQAGKVAGRKLQNAVPGNVTAKLTGGKGIVSTTDKLGKVSNNTIARLGAAAVSAGLAGAAGYNAYRAATTKRAAKKAAQFRSEMNKAFAGTKYASSSSNKSHNKKRRNRT